MHTLQIKDPLQAKMWLIIWLYMMVLVWRCESYPSGNIVESCIDMFPQHNANAQNSAPPYTITTDKLTYKAGDSITVTLSASSGGIFKGFLLQARQVGTNTIIGSFGLIGSNSQLLNCAGTSNSAVSHTSSVSKTQIQSVWKAPSTGNAVPIEFRATVVSRTNIFWMGVKSTQISNNNTTVQQNSNAVTTASSNAGSVTTLQQSTNTNCGSSAVCMSQPSNCNPATDSSCYFMSIAPTGLGSELIHQILGPAAGYVSIGYSDDKEMGNDDIYICGKNSSGMIQVQHAFSTGSTQPNIITLGDVTVLGASVTNGVINCTFTSRNSISTTRSSASSNSYYLFFAYGAASNGLIQKHSSAPLISNTKVNPYSPQDVKSEAIEPIIKAHGCLMLISWMTTGSIGMLIARFLKKSLSKTKCFGKDLWFVVHVALMMLSVIETSIAFILVFSDVKDWSGGAHPVLGCLVMILSLFQPLGAVFRCSPHDDRRFIFNWMHAINALAIKGLAVGAIFTGLLLVDSSDSQWLPKVMGGFVAWEALLFLCQDFYHRMKEKDVSDEYGCISPGVVLLLIYILGNLAFLVALLVGIGTA